MSRDWNPRPLREFFEDTMRQRGWNVSELARAAGTSNSVVGRWMRGESRPSATKLRDVADGLHVDYEQLLVRAGYIAESTGTRTGWHADLCAKLERIPLTQQQYELLDATLSVMLEQSTNPLVQKPTG